SGRLLAVGIVNSVRLPAVVRLPIRLPPDSANQRVLVPAGPAVIPAGVRPAARVNSASAPVVVTRATLSMPGSVIHRAPSGPVVIDSALPPRLSANSFVTMPAVVIRPTRSAACSVNHKAPSGP